MAGHLRFDIDSDELAQKLGGGLPRSALGVVVGPAGGGKSILCQRVAYGVLRHGGKVAMVSSELDLWGFLEQMRNVGYAVEMDYLARKLTFHSTHPRGRNVVPRPLHLRRLLASGVHREADLVIVDRFSSLLRDAQALGLPASTPVDAALHVLLQWSRQGKTVLLTVDPEDMGDDDLSALERVMDMYFEVREEMVGQTALHLLKVRRFARPMRRVTDIIGFRVEPGAGILLEIKAVH